MAGEAAAALPENTGGTVKGKDVDAQPEVTNADVTSQDPGVTDQAAQEGADELSPTSGKVRSSSGDEGPSDGHVHAHDHPVSLDNGEDGIPAGVGNDPGEPTRKRKPKKKRKGGLLGNKKASGFEEFYADPPITPAEAAEEEGMYSQSRPFSDRMEECIQRYRARRRFDNERTTMFNKYLFMGGIDSQQRQFTGMAMDTEALAGADKDQVRTMTAVDFIGGAGNRFFEIGDEEHWDVDFEGVVKGFLSRTILEIYMYDALAFEKASTLIHNFLNYVLMHNVCPEYADNVMAARNICNIAPLEMRAVHELFTEIPGSFNSAATSLFCGDGAVHDLDKSENFDKLVIFRLTVLEASTNKEARKKLTDVKDVVSIHVVDTKEETYEVHDITRPRRKYKKMFEEQLEQMQLQGKVKPAGCVVLKPAIIEHGYGNMPRPDEVDFSDAPTEEYLFEDDILGKLERGMKLKLVVCELNIGIRFVKEILDIRVSFDTFLPQALMASWRDPVPNERPPPSVANPEAETKTADTLAGDDDFAD